MTYAKTIAGQLADMTAENRHSEALAALCDAFTALAPLRGAARSIWADHRAQGHITGTTAQERRALMHRAFDALTKELSAADLKAIRGAF